MEQTIVWTLRLITGLVLVSNLLFPQLNLEDKISEAILRKDNKEVERILKTGFKQSDDDINKFNLLVYAAVCNNLGAVKLLLKYGYDINKKGGEVTQNKMTALHTSILFKNIEIANYLLRKGSAINITDDRLQTPLHVAAHNNIYDIVVDLVNRGAVINVRDKDGDTPLMLGYRFPKIVKYLLKKGADPNMRNFSGASILLNVYETFGEIDQVDPIVIKSLKEYGAKLNDKEKLFAACYKGNIEDLKRLLDKKIPVDTVLKNSTCLVAAIKKQNLEVIQILVEAGADVNNLLLNATPLMYAIKSKNINIVKYLIERGADVNLPDKFGLTPLKVIKLNMVHTTSEIINLLVSKGAVEKDTTNKN